MMKDKAKTDIKNANSDRTELTKLMTTYETLVVDHDKL